MGYIWIAWNASSSCQYNQAFLNTTYRNRIIIGRPSPPFQPILWTRMRVPKQQRRQPRHRIIEMRNTIISPCLRRNVIGADGIKSPRATISINITRIPNLPQISPCNSSNGSAQAMACYHKFVTRKGGYSVGDSGNDCIFYACPAGIETIVCFTGSAKLAGCEGEFEIVEPII